MTELLGNLLASPTDGVTAVFERHFPTGVDDLWDAVTNPERLARWFAPVEGRLQIGGEFVIRFDDADTPSCRVTACDPAHGFAWEWRLAAGVTLVEVSVSAVDDGSLLSLRHSRLGEEQAPEYAAGWQAYLLSLDAHVRAGEPRDWWADFQAARVGYASATS